MGLEGQDERAEPSGLGQAAEPVQNPAMAEVKAVEIAHRHRGGAGEGAERVEAAENSHEPTF